MYQNKKILILLLTALLAITLLVGCSDDKMSIYNVQGTVTYDGAPLEKEANITVSGPEFAEDVTATTDSEGDFVLPGLAGEVTIKASYGGDSAEKVVTEATDNLLINITSDDESDGNDGNDGDDILEIKEIDTLFNVSVVVGTTKDELALPQEISVILEDDSKVSVEVDWNLDSYNGEQGGSYELKGELTNLPDNIKNPAGVQATITVEVLGETDAKYFDFDSSTGTITNYKVDKAIDDLGEEKALKVVIPSKIGEDTVKIIGYRAFRSKDLTEVTIPDSVTTISGALDGGAFAGNELTKVTISKNVEEIGTKAFERNKLTEVTIPENVKTIDGIAFYSNELTEINIPDSVETIGRSAFADNKLTEVTIPDSVTLIFANAFKSNELTEITFPANITQIRSDAFRDNNLTEITIPGSVETISEGAFRDNNLTEVTIPENVTFVGEYAFMGNELTEVTIPANVTSVGAGAFDGNDELVKMKLTSLDVNDNILDVVTDSVDTLILENGITEIPYRSFARSSDDSQGLKEITIPASVTSVGNDAFAGNPLTKVTLNVVGSDIVDNIMTVDNTIETLIIGDSVTGEIDSDLYEGLTKLIIGDGVNTISRSGPFYDNSLEELVLGKSVETIKVYNEGDSAFPFGDIKKVELNMSTISKEIVDNIFGTGASAKDTSYIWPETLIIGDNVTKIGEDAFNTERDGKHKDRVLTELVLGNSVETIGDDAFKGNKLTEVTIPDNVTKIGSFAFSKNDLTEITIPDNVELMTRPFGYNGFKTVYDNNDQAAGTYVLEGGTWKKQ